MPCLSLRSRKFALACEACPLGAPPRRAAWPRLPGGRAGAGRARAGRAGASRAAFTALSPIKGRSCSSGGCSFETAIKSDSGRGARGMFRAGPGGWPGEEGRERRAEEGGGGAALGAREPGAAEAGA